MIKTRQTRFKNRLMARLNDVESGRWLGLVPKSTALMDHCKQRNYGTNQRAYVARKAIKLKRILGL